MIQEKFKIKFECQKCQDQFSIDFNSFMEAPTVSCSNCEESIPKEVLHNMQSGLKSFQSAIQTLRLNKDDKSDCDWRFALNLDYITIL